MTVKEFFESKNVYISMNQQCHIFDSHQEMLDQRGMKHKDEDFIVYTYNIHKNNKPKEGDPFLYRRPGKSTRNRKFNIYGGGIIDVISEPDKEGNVEAKIKHPFKLKEQIVQGDAFIEEYIWKSKNKIGGWGHFWSQYGMNVISLEDYYGLVGDRECIDQEPLLTGHIDVDIVSTEKNRIRQLDRFLAYTEKCKDPTPITIEVYDKKNDAFRRSFLNEERFWKDTENYYQQLEMLMKAIIKDEKKEQIESGEIVFIKDDVSSRLYDIWIIYADGTEEYIDIKIARDDSPKGSFRLSERQVVFSKEKGNSYKVYYMFDFNMKEGSIKVKKYEGPFTQDRYRMIPQGYIIFEK